MVSSDAGMPRFFQGRAQATQQLPIGVRSRSCWHPARPQLPHHFLDLFPQLAARTLRLLARRSLRAQALDDLGHPGKISVKALANREQLLDFRTQAVD
jgi:hypothetical protein